MCSKTSPSTVHYTNTNSNTYTKSIRQQKQKCIILLQLNQHIQRDFCIYSFAKHRMLHHNFATALCEGNRNEPRLSFIFRRLPSYHTNRCYRHGPFLFPVREPPPRKSDLLVGVKNASSVGGGPRCRCDAAACLDGRSNSFDRPRT